MSKPKPKEEIEKICKALLDSVLSNGLTLDELAQYLRQALKPYANHNDLCIDCAVLRCEKREVGYVAVGSTINEIPFVCNRRKRCYTWAQVQKAKEDEKKEEKPKGTRSIKGRNW